MDTPSSSASLTESVSAPAGQRVPDQRWLWVPLALGAGLALVELLLSEMAPFVPRLANPAPAQELEFFERIRLGEVLFAPVVALLVALIIALRGPARAARRSVTLRVVGALVLMVGTAVWIGFSNAGNLDLYAFLPTALAEGFPLGVALVVIMRLAAPQIMPAGAVVSRAAYGALAGALAGVAATALPFLLGGVPSFLLGGGPSFLLGGGLYIHDYLLMLWSFALPLMVGGALGGLISSLLLPDLRAAAPGRPEGAEAPVAAPLAHWWLARIAPRVGVFLVGVLYALLVLFCAYLTSPPLSWPSFPAGEVSDTAHLLLSLLALAVPAALLALAASPAGARRVTGGRALWAALLVLAVGVAVGVPALLVLMPPLGGLLTPLAEETTFSAVPLMAIGFGAAVGLLAGRFAAPPPARAAWRTGLRAATVGWLGVSLVIEAWLGALFFFLVPWALWPPLTVCQRQNCGLSGLGLVTTIPKSAIFILVLGLPAALFAGAFAGKLAGAQFSHSGSSATPSASTMRL